MHDIAVLVSQTLFECLEYSVGNYCGTQLPELYWCINQIQTDSVPCQTLFDSIESEPEPHLLPSIQIMHEDE